MPMAIRRVSRPGECRSQRTWWRGLAARWSACCWCQRGSVVFCRCVGECDLALDGGLAEEECWAYGKRFRASVGYAGSGRGSAGMAAAFSPATAGACRRARGRQGQALRVAAKWRPSLTSARHGSGIVTWSGRKNGFAEVEPKNSSMVKPRANISVSWRKLTKQRNQALSVDADAATL